VDELWVGRICASFFRLINLLMYIYYEPLIVYEVAYLADKDYAGPNVYWNYGNAKRALTTIGPFCIWWRLGPLSD
jgi:hypothetical protein